MNLRFSKAQTPALVTLGDLKGMQQVGRDSANGTVDTKTPARTRRERTGFTTVFIQTAPCYFYTCPVIGLYPWLNTDGVAQVLIGSFGAALPDRMHARHCPGHTSFHFMYTYITN